MTTLHFKVEMAHLLRWFDDSPEEGDPACICSHCEQVIADHEIALRVFHGRKNIELRLHMNCAKQVIQEFARTP